MKLWIIASGILLITIFMYVEKSERDNWVSLYEGKESTIGEAQEIYWYLKNNNINFKYDIPINWNNYFRTKYEECSVFIEVPHQEIVEARKLLRQYHHQKDMSKTS